MSKRERPVDTSEEVNTLDPISPNGDVLQGFKKKGRPPKYRSILLALDGEWLYSAGQIAWLAEKTGLLPLQEKESDEKLRVQRLRIALGRKSKPKEESVPTAHSMRPYPAWSGWRWQGFESAAQARALRNEFISLLLEQTTKQVLSWFDLVRASLQLEGNVWTQYLGNGTPQFRQAQVRVLLTRHSQRQGFVLDKSYCREYWCSPIPLKGDRWLRIGKGLLASLLGSEIYSPNDIVQLGMIRKDISLDDEEQRCVRMALYDLARRARFPEIGLGYGALSTRWTGRMWKENVNACFEW